jgi:hypothetical protein
MDLHVAEVYVVTASRRTRGGRWTGAGLMIDTGIQKKLFCPHFPARRVFYSFIKYIDEDFSHLG